MSKQVPDRAETFLDHVAHFVPSLDVGAATLERLGFRLTPFTAQQNWTPNGMVPAGMANHCVMLREGYIEFLTAVADTELARQFRAAIARHVGPHLIAFSTGDLDLAHGILESNGFRPQPPVNLVRPVSDADGQLREARFSVLRVPPETMPEGRIQLLKHHTEDIVWQPRWLGHPNGIVGLKAVLLATADPEESARRFGCFVGRVPVRRYQRWVLQLDRGACVFIEHSALHQVVPWVHAAKPAPWIVGMALESEDTGRTREHFAAGGLQPHETAPSEAVYGLPPELGGFATVLPAGADVSWAA
ncbi:VOC family protein [Aurantimonas sp. A3-2-R12]|uniref:VOC family protein n=1 Tax=Aurantimonas sp. A3-2-R12 TaxID=3114362 RepID=UPI002E17F109|nr:VOC family protein [Aurantimonas sp. A3-2-R12]